MKHCFLILLAAMTFDVAAIAQRLDCPLNASWKFHRGPSTVMTSADNWEDVTLPHTWNAVDGQSSGKNRLDDNGQALLNDGNVKITDPTTKYGYYRGAGWYMRPLDIPEEWKGKRVFVRFEAAGQVARVYINGRMLGEHRGAFTAFCYELTPYIIYGACNQLRVEVDNTHREDIPPLSGDFNINGGLYRPAKLIVTDKICISPLDYASSGVYVTARNVSPSGTDVCVTSLISNGKRIAMSNEPAANADVVEVETLIKDRAGNVVASDRVSKELAPDVTAEINRNLHVRNPHLWNGRKDPYLYSVVVNVIREGEVVDSVVQPLGVRTFRIDDKAGFLLNEVPYPVYGVGRHQDLKGKAWAMTEEDNERDYAIMKEIGATAIRFAHYPQSENMHDIADREGFLVWDEIPLVNEIRLDNDSKHNVRNMMREMVKQLYNHPSVAWWGIYNEIENIYTPPSEDFLTELREDIRAIDRSCRMVTGASDHGLRPHNRIPDATCFNNYPGWYHGNFPKEEGYTGEHSQFRKWISDRAKEVGMRIAVSEYGAGGDAAQHTEGVPCKPQPAHGGPFQPEEWLTYVHEEDLRIMKGNGDLWGTFLWAMFDFASCMRNEGSVPSVNTKGIVSQDRSLRKDPYFLYKANWNPSPMVYITSRRSVERVQQVTDIKVYSNCPEVTLKVNGKKIGTMKPDEIKVCLFRNVFLSKGCNRIEVFAKDGKTKVSDRCEWNLTTD